VSRRARKVSCYACDRDLTAQVKEVTQWGRKMKQLRAPFRIEVTIRDPEAPKDRPTAFLFCEFCKDAPRDAFVIIRASKKN
jgi:hypothetical protein